MAAFGRKQPVKIPDFREIERPLLVKADIQNPAPEKWLANGRFTPGSCRWDNIGEIVSLWLKDDIFLARLVMVFKTSSPASRCQQADLGTCFNA
jgi:hypothetical protein